MDTKAEIVGLTKKQFTLVSHFLDLFTDVEGVLKMRLGLRADDRTGMKVLINGYEAINPFWRHSANRLRHLSDIRNVLTHQRGTAFGFPLAITSHSVEALLAIKEHLETPEPVSDRYRRQVKTVSATDSLAHVVALAFENGFSQFPVIDDGQFLGLITETEITRWLGRRAKANTTEVNLQDAIVRTVLREKDPTMKGITIFRFTSLDTPIEEVMGLFSAEALLEVVLLTQSGNRHTRIEGIITQWDAARYSSSQ